MSLVNSQKVYLPTNARDNQYLLIDFTISNAFINYFDSHEACYSRLSSALFDICDQHSLSNVHFIANNKLPVVRYSEEPLTLETNSQILFFYNHLYHESHKIHANKHANNKIKLLFLATGDNLRANAAYFHKQVCEAVNVFKSQFDTSIQDFKLRDHQHLTYDLFTKEKGNKECYGYKLRPLYSRYQARGFSLPTSYKDMTYITFNLPITRNIKKEYHSILSQKEYKEFYTLLKNYFCRSCENIKGIQAAIIANGKVPIIRHEHTLNNIINNEYQPISFDLDSSNNNVQCFLDKAELHEIISFVIVAKNSDKKEIGYGKFLNNVESIIKKFTNTLPIVPLNQDLNVRFFQHISYQLKG